MTDTRFSAAARTLGPAPAADVGAMTQQQLLDRLAEMQKENEALKTQRPGSPRKTEVGVRFVPYAGRAASSKTVNGVNQDSAAKPPCDMLQIQAPERGVPCELTVSPSGFVSIAGLTSGNRPLVVSVEGLQLLCAHAAQINEFAARNGKLLKTKH